jgi:hypothetical protein
VGYILQTLANGFRIIGAGGKVEQALIGCGVLHDGRRLSVHGKHHGAFALLELFHEVAGLAAESRQRLDVFGDVKHGSAPIGSTLFDAIGMFCPGKWKKPT